MATIESPATTDSISTAVVSSVTADGEHAIVEVTHPNGDRMLYSAPTRGLGVLFTARGVVEVDAAR